MSAARDLGLPNDVRIDAVPASAYTPAGEMPDAAVARLPGLATPREERAASATSVIQALDDLDELSDAWGVLSAQSGMPMQDYAWIRAAASSFVADGRLHIVVTGVPPNITAIAPLVRSRNRDTCLELLGVNELYEPMDFLYATPSALATLTDALAGFKGCLFLNRMPASSAVSAALRRSYRGRGIVICTPASGYPGISLDARWMHPEVQFNAGRRSDFRRARRTAEKLGPVAFEVLRPTPGELEPLLDEAFRVEAASWKGHERTALVHDSVREPFYREYAAAACGKGALLVCFLRIGVKAVAMQIAVTSGDRFWLLRIGHDTAFARCSPGTLLMLETVRYAEASGLHSYEFLGTDEPWTRMWTQLIRPCVSLRAYPAGMRGMSGFAADCGDIAYRRFRQTLRKIW